MPTLTGTLVALPPQRPSCLMYLVPGRRNTTTTGKRRAQAHQQPRACVT